MPKGKTLTYSQALSELEKTVAEIESEKTDVDVLAEKVRRAGYLIRFCRTKLKSTEEEVRKALTELEEQSEPGVQPAHEEEPGA